ncbi:MAG: class I SAM-dependent methyltransferase [Alphaproteobacteria bacterium]|jgi:ubiquinone/menaquinone biosynthesis C-methylase UbiE|nr:class I SAM-dependent methyltransferase [Alphaproteobacteria bacterium]|tara:strand:+ start:224 stop:922 length:699 start_codon:yes stop_codon:yes gene_type:complete
MSRRDETPPSWDPVWEEIYAGGQENRYPWDAVVSFLFRYRPRDLTPEQTKVLEMGCGTAPNLWFAAREGFQVSGIDGSKAAITRAQQRFEEDGLGGDLRVGDFTSLPFAADEFHLAIDRAALSTCGLESARLAIAEAHRVLRPGGVFFCNPYSHRHPSRTGGRLGDDGLTMDISAGSLVGAGQICFYGRGTLLGQFPNTQWRVLALSHMEVEPITGDTETGVAEWRLVAEKI